MKYIFRKIWHNETNKLSSFFKKNIKSEYDDQNIIFNEIDTLIRSFQDDVPSVSIVTPSVGSPFLEKNIESVLAQSYRNFEHIIVIDGNQYKDQINAIISSFPDRRIKLIELPHNTGRKGLNGHRVYVAIPFLLNSQYILFLDEDNWLETDHVFSVVEAMQAGSLEWVYSFRNIYTESGQFVCKDLCESIGEYTPYSNMNPLVDTSCYAFRRSAIVKFSRYWYHHKDTDRYFFYHLKQVSPRFMSTGKYTVNYRLTDARPPHPEFFLSGNRYMMQKYGGKLPWLT